MQYRPKPRTKHLLRPLRIPTACFGHTKMNWIDLDVTVACRSSLTAQILFNVMRHIKFESFLFFHSADPYITENVFLDL